MKKFIGLAHPALERVSVKKKVWNLISFSCASFSELVTMCTNKIMDTAV